MNAFFIDMASIQRSELMKIPYFMFAVFFFCVSVCANARGKNNEVDVYHLYTMYIPDKQIIHI